MDTIEHRINDAIQKLKYAETSEYIGEPVSQLEHALQGAYFAEQSGHSEDVILATLFHDIGHFASDTQQLSMADVGIVNHEWIGAKLAYDLGFSVNVALLIGYHVDAKRYLAAKKQSYYERLSEASKKTLVYQGGPMSEDQQAQFERHPLFKEILQVRINDEKGKIAGLAVPDLTYYRIKIEKHFLANLDHRVNDTAILSDFVTNDWVMKFKGSLDAST
jgi:predicted HD phosphohydrolase